MNTEEKAQRDEKLAASLTAESTELLPHLPYLLQDLWELGGSPELAIKLLKQAGLRAGSKVLDLACGKGAVAVRMAKALEVHVKGIDLFAEFVEYAKNKAKEFGVEELCTFETADVNLAVEIEKGYDCVIFSAAGDVLGEAAEMLGKLKQVVRPDGFIVLDESYLKDEKESLVRYQHYELLTRAQWDRLFAEQGLKVWSCEEIEEDSLVEMNRSDMAAITLRAAELSKRYPEQKALFDAYVKSQQDEVLDVENDLVNVVWLLQKQAQE